MDLTKRFSIAHYDNWPHPSLYYDAIKRSTADYKAELFDIYFGKIFRYKYREQEAWDNYARPHEVSYGNVMGVEASDEQVDNLFRIQKEFGIDISLTINQMNIPVEMFYSKNDRVARAFIEWLREFYDRGLRSCTLANNHLMRTGVLHREFPEMKWKNTVNQQVSSAQQVLDYLYLGYNVVQLDRSLACNFDELKRIKEVVEGFKAKNPNRLVKTCMLVWEDCMPFCPFKREHDDLQIYLRKINYWQSGIGALTCNHWTDKKGGSVLPRFGTNSYWVSTGSFAEYAEVVDVFKYSGRLRSFDVQPSDDLQAGWVSENKLFASSFAQIFDNRLEPIHMWQFGVGVPGKMESGLENIKIELQNNAWMTEKGRSLEQRLKNCKNQCYRCHMCERANNLDDIDSAIQI